MKLLNVEKQDNIEFYLSCKFQPSTFNVRCKTDVTDGMPDKQTNELPYAVAPPALGIITAQNTLTLVAFSTAGRSTVPPFVATGGSVGGIMP